MKHPSQYVDQEVVILGLAKSGLAVAKLFYSVGARVTVNDKKERHLTPEADELEALGVSVICGQHPETLIHSAVKLVVKNPGIPYWAPPVKHALEMGIEIVTEVEVAYQLTNLPIIGITGSNGKTTTTTWIGKMLEAAGKEPLVAGNIGIPLTDAVEDSKSAQVLVVELSSFQLKGTQEFRPMISCLLNIAETHLDYHETMDDYIASKAKILANQNEHQTAVVNWDDSICRSLALSSRAYLLPFSQHEELPFGVFVKRSAEAEAAIVYCDADKIEHFIISVSQLGIPGSYNVDNAMAAAAASIAYGAPIETIREVLHTFRGVEHRLEFVREKQGIIFYNNSKATNSIATIKAIEAVGSGKNLVLIAGGLDRGADYQDLVPFFEQEVKAVVALGQTAEKFHEISRQAGISRIKVVDTASNAAAALHEAVQEAFAFAESVDVILLSPACASWDMFSSYEERGRIFKESVHNL